MIFDTILFANTPNLINDKKKDFIELLVQNQEGFSGDSVQVQANGITAPTANAIAQGVYDIMGSPTFNILAIRGQLDATAVFLKVQSR